MKSILKITFLVATIIGLSGCDTSAPIKNVPTQNAPVALKDDVTIVASDFQFDQTEYRVKKGEQVKFTLTNQSGVHGILIPDLNISMETAGTQTFKLDKPGTYQIVCNQPCGSGHLAMKATLTVE